MTPTPRFIQGVFPFEGRGLETPGPIGASVTYVVPADRRAQLIYMRGGNSADDLVYLVLTKDGKPMRYFPIGAKSSIQVTLAVVEDIFPESKLALLVAAAKGVSGVLVLDLGLVEADLE
jgi:hypothetical protein